MTYSRNIAYVTNACKNTSPFPTHKQEERPLTYLMGKKADKCPKDFRPGLIHGRPHTYPSGGIKAPPAKLAPGI